MASHVWAGGTSCLGKRRGEGCVMGEAWPGGEKQDRMIYRTLLGNLKD